MIAIDFPFANVVAVTPEGALTEGDFDHLAQVIDEYINTHDVVPNLLVHPRGIPRWSGIKAMQKHLHFVREHHKLVRKIAIVGDIGLLTVLPPLIDHFVGAKIRHFPEEKIEAARAWVQEADDHPGQFELIDDDLPNDVVGLRVSGIITAQDYRDMLVPLVEKKLKRHDQLKILIVIDESFISYTPEAAWDDARFGFNHWADFGRIALVTDIGWIRTSARLFAPLIRADLHVFALNQLADAKRWIKR